MSGFAWEGSTGLSENMTTSAAKNEANEVEDSLHSSYGSAMLLLICAFVLFTAADAIYAANKPAFFTAGSPIIYSSAATGLLCVGAVLLALSAYSFFSAQKRMPFTTDTSGRVHRSLGKVVSNSVARYKSVGMASAILYALFFSFVDAILIYQPKVNFAATYSVTRITALFYSCCGPPGYAPLEDVYFPAQHFGLQLIPISIMIMILVSALVGVNVSLLYAALRQAGTQAVQSSTSPSGSTSETKNVVRKKGFASGALGAAFGLFAGCPTCAAAFFLSMIAGSGADAVSFLIAEYQPLIIGLTIPLLVASILFQAKSIRAFLEGCPL